ncbi:polyprenyl synthetase family protein [Patescibacteria group bacterium]
MSFGTFFALCFPIIVFTPIFFTSFVISEKHKSEPEILFPFLRYPILHAGKKVRSTLVLIACQLLGGKIKNALPLAAGLEILHNYTLIIDDMIDNSPLRRGKPTVWVKYGNSIAQCAGLDYAASILQAANRSKNPEKVSALFAKTLKIVTDGEILDILFEQSGREEEPYIVKNRPKKITEKDYFKMVSEKTASLFEACCEAGGMAASGSKKELAALKNYGHDMGIAFQVQDDILDIFGEPDIFGKRIGQDIIERKRGNIVILYALKQLSTREKNLFLSVLKKRRITNKDIKKVIKLIKKTNAVENSYQYGKKYIDKAKKNLKKLPKNKWNKVLDQFADFVIERQG